MRSSWDPLTLTFSDTELEQHYRKHLAISTFVSVDKAFAYFGIWSCVWMAYLHYAGSLSANFLLNAVVNGLCGLVVVAALKLDRRSRWIKYRTATILILRTVRVVTGLCSYSFQPNLHHWYEFMRMALYGPLCIFWCCGMPLTLKVTPCMSDKCDL